MDPKNIIWSLILVVSFIVCWRKQGNQVVFSRHQFNLFFWCKHYEKKLVHFIWVSLFYVIIYHLEFCPRVCKEKKVKLFELLQNFYGYINWENFMQALFRKVGKKSARRTLDKIKIQATYFQTLYSKYFV